MDLQNFEQLEDRINELTQRFLDLKQAHREALDALSQKSNEMEVLNEKLRESQQSKVQIHSRVENILKKLEFLKSEADQ